MSDEKRRARMAALPYSEWRRLMDLQILAMVAHACEELARKARHGWRFDLIESAARMIAVLAWSDDPTNTYCRALSALGYTPEQIDAAVSAIERGEHPPGSLPERVETLLRINDGAAVERMRDGDAIGAERAHGVVGACTAVLDMLGVP